MKKKKRISIQLIIFLILLGVFCYSTYRVVSQFIQDRKEDNAFAALISQVESGDFEIDDSGMLKAYAELYEENNDLYGWIKIEGTKINYPVMFTPKIPEYYLRKAFDKTYAESGVPFIDASYYDGCGHYIIYSHNMKNGTMFSVLPQYSSILFYEEHPIINFDTLYETHEYLIFAAFYSRAYYEDEVGVFRYYNYKDLSSPFTFDEYISQVRDASVIYTGVDVEYGDEILTLSTCEYSEENGRFVVVAKKIK